MRRALLAPILLSLACGAPDPDAMTTSDLSEATIHDLQRGMQSGALTSEAIVAWYLDRVERFDRSGPELRAVIETNPDALETARALDRERGASGPRGALHGIPVLLKANIDTADRMHTSAGSLALAEHRPPEDAPLVRRLREAGAVILGKANLSEWANFRSSHSTSGWSSVGGQTKNPYDPARNPCGSSSGSAVAVAANLVTIAIGTETDGSILCPAGTNGVVGIKPTLGLVSAQGIVPIAHSQDTAGPMARSVHDAALLLGAMSGRDFAGGLASADLAGKRIGVLRSHRGVGALPSVEAVLAEATDALRAAGAEIVDPTTIETGEMHAAEYQVLLYEFKADLNRYLEASRAPLRTLADVIAWNEANAERVMPFFGQNTLLAAQAKGPLTEPAYREALETSRRIARGGLDRALREHALDALVAPTNGPAWLTDPLNGDSGRVGSASFAAIAGYPNVTVPAGDVSGLPIGLSFMGAPGADAHVIALAHAFEQATRARRAPEL